MRTAHARVTPLRPDVSDSIDLRPARVLLAAGRRVQLELPDGTPWAFLALAFPYEPVSGDTVLAIGQRGAWYVIGVLQGSGKTTMTVPADLELRAPRGFIDLASAKGVRITSPDVAITARKLDVTVETIFESVVHATRWVKETLHLRAGRIRTRVATIYDVKADRITQRADGDVKIDGRKIHLG